ncbi:MAG: hypothetical protein R2991_13900 [Thermoanaerobaculia bacterium]
MRAFAQTFVPASIALCLLALCASASAEPIEADPTFGPALEAPELYYGVYADSDQPSRQWFVSEAKRPQFAEHAPEVPPGHLMIGALFGDVAPWQMKTLSETDFEQAWVMEGQEPVTVRFELDADGRAVALTFTDPMLADQGRLERRGDLPDDLR